MKKLLLTIFIFTTVGCGNSLSGSVHTPLGTFSFASPEAGASPKISVNVSR